VSEVTDNSNGNGEKRTLRSLIKIYLGIITVFFAVTGSLVALVYGSMQELLEKTAERAADNTERIIRLELMNDLRSAGLLHEE